MFPRSGESPWSSLSLLLLLLLELLLLLLLALLLALFAPLPATLLPAKTVEEDDEPLLSTAAFAVAAGTLGVSAISGGVATAAARGNAAEIRESSVALEAAEADDVEEKGSSALPPKAAAASKSTGA